MSREVLNGSNLQSITDKDVLISIPKVDKIRNKFVFKSILFGLNKKVNSTIGDNIDYNNLSPENINKSNYDSKKNLESKEVSVKIFDGKEENGDFYKDLYLSSNLYLKPQEYQIIAGSDIGSEKKKRNEDRVVINLEDNIFAVLDGMGCYRYSEKASENFALKLILSMKDEIKKIPIEEKKLLAEKIKYDIINTNINEVEPCFNMYNKLNPEDIENNPNKMLYFRYYINWIAQQFLYEMRKNKLEDSGICMLIYRIVNLEGKKQVQIARAGDCRMIIVDNNYKIIYESEDHNESQILINNNIVCKKNAAINLCNSAVTNYLSPKTSYKPDFEEVDVYPGYQIYAFSDGITGNLRNYKIIELTKNESLNGSMKEISNTTDFCMKYKDKIRKENNPEIDYDKGFLPPKIDNRSAIIQRIL